MKNTITQSPSKKFLPRFFQKAGRRRLKIIEINLFLYYYTKVFVERTRRR